MKTRLFFCLLVVALCFGVKSASAGTNFTWKAGVSSGNWNNPANWTGGTGSNYPGSASGVTDNVTIGTNTTIAFTAAVPGTIGTIAINNATTFNLTANLTAGAVTIGSVTVTFSGGSTFKCSSLSATNSLNINTPVIVTGTAGLSGGTITITGSSFEADGNLTCSSTINTTGTSTVTCDGTTNTMSNLTVTSGALTLAGTGTTTITAATLSNSSTNLSTSGTCTNKFSAFTMNSSSQLLTIGAGTILSFNSLNFTPGNGSCGITNNGEFDINGSTFAPGGSPFTLTNNKTLKSNSNLTFGNNGNFQNLSPAIATLTANVSMTGSSETFNNTGSFSITTTTSGTGFTMATGTFTNSGQYYAITAPLSFASGTVAFSNTATGYMTFTVTSTLNITSNGDTFSNAGDIGIDSSPLNIASTSTPALSNSGSFYIKSSLITLSDNNDEIKNTAGNFYEDQSNFTGSGQPIGIDVTGGTYHVTGSSITLPRTGYIKNAGATFTADSTSSIFLGDQAFISNSATGTVNIGTAGSGCTITAINPAVVSATVISNAGTFNLGSTSSITFSNTSASVAMTCANTGTFNLMSDANGSAAFGQSGATSDTYTGVYNVQRFISGGGLAANRGYRMLCLPVNATTAVTAPSSAVSNPCGLNNLSGGVYIAAPSPHTGFPNTNANGSTIYLYNETLPNSNSTFNSGKNEGVYTIRSPTTAAPVCGTLYDGTSFTLPPGNGFLLYFAGGPSAISATPPDCTITNSGWVNQGTITAYTWFTPNNGGSSTTNGHLSWTSSLTSAQGGAGWNMLGNPYPCTINLATVVSDNSSFVTAIYLLNRNNSSGQSYQAYTSGGTSSPTAGYALSGEGFLVKVGSGGNVFQFKEDQKVASQQLTGTGLPLDAFPPGSQTSDAIQTNSSSALTGLYMKLVQDSITYDYCGIYFRNGWSAKSGDDAVDIDPPTETVYMASLTEDSVLTSVNDMPDYKNGRKVKLFVNAKADGLYHLNIEGIRNIDTLYNIFLVDKYKNDSLDIRHYGTYAFNIIKSDSASFGGNRFVLDIELKPLPPYQLISFSGQKVSAGVILNWETYNEGDYTGFVLQKQNAAGQFVQLDSLQSTSSVNYSFTDTKPLTGTNVYRLKQNGITGNITYSSPVTIIYNINGDFMIYPNPSRDLITIDINSANSNVTNPNYLYSIYNTSGSLVGQKSATSNSWTQDVSAFKAGVYILVVKDANGNMVGKSKFVKTN